MVIDPEDEQKWPALTRAFKLSKQFLSPVMQEQNYFDLSGR